MTDDLARAIERIAQQEADNDALGLLTVEAEAAIRQRDEAYDAMGYDLSQPRTGREQMAADRRMLLRQLDYERSNHAARSEPDIEQERETAYSHGYGDGLAARSEPPTGHLGGCVVDCDGCLCPCHARSEPRAEGLREGWW